MFTNRNPIGVPPMGGGTPPKENSLGRCAGLTLLIAGAACVLVKPLLENDTRPEPFFLLPAGAMLTCCGIFLFILMGIWNGMRFLKSPQGNIRCQYLARVLECSAVVLGYAAVVLFLMEANSGRRTLPLFFLCAAISVFLGIAACVMNACLKAAQNHSPNPSA